MIKLCIFDMGGVLVKNFDVSQPVLAYLGHPGKDLFHLSPAVEKAITDHSCGFISEPEFWKLFEEDTGYTVPNNSSSLFNKFFNPVVDTDTLAIIRELKNHSVRVVCGTNVIDAHYEKLIKSGDYSVFNKVYASHFMGLAKPDPAFYKAILKEENCLAEEAFFTDDMQSNIESAKGLGINSHHFVNAEGLRACLIRLGILN
ncbi:hypothetical protein MASR2M29_07350 [Spirochaetota bacterium]